MLKKKFFIPFVALGLLISACGGKGGGSSEPASNPSSPDTSNPSSEPTSEPSADPSSAPSSDPTSAPSSNPTSAPASSSSTPAPSSSSSAPASSSSGTSSSSTPEPVHVHEYELVENSTVKNADDKDVYVKACKDGDDKYIGIAFDDFSEKSADFGSTSSYNRVPEDLRNESRLLAKNSTITWKINLDKAVSNADLMFGVVYTGSDHGTQGAQDGSTFKYSIKVNEGDFADWDIGDNTYDGLGMSQTERAYVRFVSINLAEGENTITLRQNNAGYRLLFGGEVQVHYAGDAKPVEAPIPFEGYNVTFVTENCKVLVYASADYTLDPEETNTCVAKDKYGNVVPYDPEDLDLQPQVNFKVVCDEGYVADKENIVITGAKYKNFKQGPDEGEALPAREYFRITKIQGDITVTITPVVDTGEEQTPGYEAKFSTLHCSVKVYVGPKDKNNATEDTEEHFYGRSKDAPYDYTRNNGQINFEVIPDAGYKFVSGLEEGAEGKVDFIGGTAAEPYNKVARGSTDYANCFRITKIACDLNIKLRCIPEAGEEGLGYEISFVTEHCQVLVYEYGQDYTLTPTAPANNKTMSRTSDGEAAKYVADNPDTADVDEEVKPQVNFLVVCEEGYEFNSGVEAGKDAKANAISFVSGSFNKFANVGEGIYKITKIQSDLVVTITATAIAA